MVPASAGTGRAVYLEMTSRPSRVSALAMTVCTVVSLLLLLASMRVYPGGTQWNRAAPGNDFWENYLCDLARTVALNGHPNPIGSLLAQLALGGLSLGLYLFFGLLSRMAPSRPRLGRAIRALGFLATTGAVLVAALPADRHAEVHGIAILLGGASGLLAAVLGILGIAWERRPPRLVARVGLLALVVALLAFIPFVRQYFVDGPGPVAAAVLERLALLCLLAWMAATAWHATRARA